MNILAIPEILENIFSYITYYKDFIKLFKVNRTWNLEGVRVILKLYRDMFYQYSHNILNILLISDFYELQGCISKPVYKKIYWPGDDYTDIHYIDYKEEFEKI